MSSTTGDKIERDNYPTPVDVINAMLAKMGWHPGDTFLEPCRGDESRIYDRVPLPESQKDWAEISMGRDYLAHDFGRQFDVIITNPPFSLTEAFLEKSLAELKPDGTLIYLQRVNFLGSIKRVPFFARIGFPNKTPVIIPRPPLCQGRNRLLRIRLDGLGSRRPLQCAERHQPPDHPRRLIEEITT